MKEPLQEGQDIVLGSVRRAYPIAEADYADMLRRYFLRRWPLYVLFVVAAVAGMYIYLKTQQDTYEVTARIVIEEPDKTGASEDLIRRSTELFSASQNVYNEIERITSYELMYSVVEELDLAYSYWTKKGLERRDGYRDFPVRLDSFRASPTTLATPTELSLRLEPEDYLTFRLYHKDELAGTYPFDSVITNTFGDFRFRLNGALPGGTAQPLHVSISDLRAVTDAYLEELEAEFTALNSTTIELSIEDAIPARGIDVLTQLMSNYNDQKLAEADRAALETLGFIDDRLQKANRQLQLVEANLEQYKLNNEIADESNSDLNLVMQNVDEFGRDKEDLTLQLNALRSLEDALAVNGEEPELITIDNSVLTSGQLPEQVQLYNRLILERKELLITGQPGNPAVVSISQRIASLRRSIESSVAVLRRSLDERQSLLQSQYSRAVGQLRSVPTKQRQVQDRSREQKIMEDLYVYLLQKKEETALAYINNVTTAKVIDSPHAGSEPVSPNKKLYFFLALVCGGAIPFFYSVAREEIFNHKVEYARDLVHVFPRHVLLGQISTSRGKNSLPAADPNRNRVSDQFRSLRNNLMVQFPSGGGCFMVTSAGKGEGKSFVAVNIALAFARAHKRVVVVDFDFYHPQVARYLGQKDGTGLSDYLGGAAALEDIIYPTSQDLGVHYIPSGTGSQRPGDLISNEAGLTDLFAGLREQFDVIVLDVPPIGILTDAVLLNRFITASLYVVRAQVTTKDSLVRGKEAFDANRLTHPLLVLNSVRSDHQNYYH